MLFVSHTYPAQKRHRGWYILNRILIINLFLFLVHLIKIMEVILINNESIIKGRVDNTLAEVLKQILTKKNMSQQDFIDMIVKDFVLQNLNLIILNEKSSK